MNRVGVVLAAVFFIPLLSCGDDKETVTNTNGFDEELILGTDPASWTAVAIRTIEPESGCMWHERESTDVSLALQNDVFRFHGTATACGNDQDACMPQELYAVLQSAERLDFTRYREARLQCTIRYGGSGVNGGLRRSIGGSGPAECVFRPNPASDSGGIRPPIPIESGHGFRSNPATDSGHSGHRGREGFGATLTRDNPMVVCTLPAKGRYRCQGRGCPCGGSAKFSD